MDTRRLSGKKAFIAGVGDDKGFGFAIAKALAEEGADIYVGTWPPVLRIFKTSYEGGKLNSALELSNGSLMDIKGIYPLDASFDTKQAVPEEILSNKRYKDVSDYTIEEVAKKVYLEVGEIDILVHSLANAPEVKKPLLETTREGYLAALSASSYSLISLLNHFGPHMSKASAALTLTYIAAEKVIPGYGGGMSSAKAALESDVRTLSYEVGRKWGMRLNAISAGPYGSRAAKAIGFIEKMIEYSFENAPLKKELLASEVAHAAAFLLSPLASAITGSILYVDNGLHVMGAALDSPTLTL
jgi:enoyl-[acyl-carrier protein] reductase I